MSTDHRGLASLPVPDPAVRAAGPHDGEELVRLFGLAAAELDGRKGSWLWERADSPFADAETALRAIFTEPWIVLLGHIDHVVVGYLIAREQPLHRDGAIGVVHGLYVEPEARGVGIADALLLSAMEHFATAGCIGVDSWALPGERETKNFYEAHGFTARTITVHHSFIEPKHTSRTEGLRQTANEPGDADHE